MKLLRLLPLALACTLCSLRAQTPQETVITSTSLEMWSKETEDETHGIFSGDVVVTGTNLRITCDRLEITAVRMGTDKSASIPKLEKFKYLLATGKVHIVQGAREANCERAEVFPREEKIILTGQPVVIDSEAGFIATGEPMELLRGKSQTVRGKNVKITLPPIKDLGPDKNAPVPDPAAPAASTKPTSPSP